MNTETQTITCHYIDTCYPDYLQDHHNRDDELLLCIPGNYGYWDWLLQDLFDQAILEEGLPSYITNSDLHKAIEQAFKGYDLKDVTCDHDDYECYIYAYLSW